MIGEGSSNFHRHSEATKGLFRIMNLLGSLPYDLRLSYQYTKFPLIYSYILLAWYTLQIPITVIVLVNLGFSIPGISMSLRKFCDILVPTMVILQALFDKGSHFKTCLEDIDFADRLLHSVGLEIEYKRAKKRMDYLFNFTTTYLTLSLGFSNYLFLFHTNFTLTRTVIFIILDISHNVYNIYFSYFYSSALIIFQFRFSELNAAIESMKKNKSVEGRIVIKVKPVDFNPGDLIKKIKTIKFAHAIFREVILFHNKKYGLVLVTQFVNCATVITFGVYFLLCNFMVGIRSKDLTVTLITLLAMIQSLLVITVTVVCSAQTAAQANNMEVVVHELIHETEEKELLQELEDFSLELYHARIAFTANDFFSLDLSVFTQIIGSVASYVIIFMQFGVNDYKELFDPPNNETNSDITGN